MNTPPSAQRLRWLFLLPWCALPAFGCGDTIGQAVELPLSASGVADPTFTQGEWEITLERAEVGFGPLYLCPASVPTGDLCEIAVVELTDSATLDALDAAEQTLPPLSGTTGTVRSAVFDYAISWPLTFRSPRPGPGAPGGHSARFAGTASDGSRTLEFSADVDVTANAVERLASGTFTEHTITDGSSRLHVVFDPVRWWQGVDFEALATTAFEDPDAAAEGVAAVAIEPTSPAYASIVHEMSAGVRPRLEWSRSAE